MLDKKTIKSSEDMMQKQIKKAIKSKDVEIISDVIKGTPYEAILKEQEARKSMWLSLLLMAGVDS